jgi:hypothetical protein
MSSAVALKMSGSGGGKKKPGFMDASDPVNPDTEDETGSADMATGDSGKSEPNDTGDSEGPSDIGDEGEGPEMGSYDAVEDDAASELAGIVGVPDDKREAFKSALSDYVAACVKKQSKGK